MTDLNINLDDLGRKELEILAKRVDKALADFDARRRKDALQAAQQAAAEFGFSLADILGGKPKGLGASSNGAAKYRNPDDPNITWTGRGRQPTWFRSYIVGGGEPADLEI